MHIIIADSLRQAQLTAAIDFQWESVARNRWRDSNTKAIIIYVPNNSIGYERMRHYQKGKVYLAGAWKSDRSLNRALDVVQRLKFKLVEQ